LTAGFLDTFRGAAPAIAEVHAVCDCFRACPMVEGRARRPMPAETAAHVD